MENVREGGRMGVRNGKCERGTNLCTHVTNLALLLISLSILENLQFSTQGREYQPVF